MHSHESQVDSRPRVLVVDDDDGIVQVIGAFLEDEWEVVGASNALQAKQIVDSGQSFALVISDHIMDEMTGFELLLHIQEVSADTVRILMSGTKDYDVVVDALNSDAIFRFIKKPITGPMIRQIAQQGYKQHQLLIAEKDLLSRTLSSTIEFMNQALAVVRPLEYGTALYAARTIRSLTIALKRDNQWELIVATMLSCSGFALLPSDIVYRLHRGKKLSDEQSKQYANHYITCADLVKKIPRLQRVAKLIELQRTDTAPIETKDESLLHDAKLVRLALNFADHKRQCDDDVLALERTQRRKRLYNDDALEALAKLVESSDHNRRRSVTVEQLRPGMVLCDNVLNLHNQLLVSRGNEVTGALAERLRNFKAGSAGVKEPLIISG